MKKALLLLLSLLMLQTASAQYYLTGAGYSQDFNSIGSGLPQGWEVDTASTTIFKGYPKSFDTARFSWSNATGKFKNFASKDTFSSTASSAYQAAASNRALGLRATAAFGDSNTAFIFQVANTLNL